VGRPSASIDGRLCALEDARVGVLDRGFLYGDSVFETLRVYRGIPFRLDEHLARLRRSGERIAFLLPWSDARMRWDCYQTLSESGLADAVLRVVATRGSGPIGHDPALAKAPCLVVLAMALPTLPASWYQCGRSATLVHEAIIAGGVPGAKTGSGLRAVLAMARARERGCEEAILVNRDGLVSEASSANVFIDTAVGWITPQLDDGGLSGITRKTLLSLCDAREASISSDTLLAARQVFLCSSVRELLPIVRVDAHTIGDGRVAPSFAALLADYRRIAGEHEAPQWPPQRVVVSLSLPAPAKESPLVPPPRRGRAHRKDGEVRVGVAVDVANLAGAARRAYHHNVDLSALLALLVSGRRLVEAGAFAIAKDPSGFRRFSEALRGAGFQVFGKRPQTFSDGSVKADWDVGLAVYAIELAERCDVVVLCTGDGDFVPLVRAIKRRGLRVEVAAFPGRLSAALRGAADSVFDLDEAVLERL
jgi:branched-chain amino acid aminotransferase